MRFYLKLLAAVVVFTTGMGMSDRNMAADIAFDLRVAYTYRCGSAADVERLIVDTQKQLSEERGETECYDFGQRYERLLAARLAEARMDGVTLTDETRLAIEAECGREAFASTRWAKPGEPRRPTQLDKVQSSAIELAGLFLN